ncbi:MAG: hypothetical protein PHS97_07175 [Oscillospiraceae bacterium]|nr:hypothetical protein [Oscillospiraceae bacterium]
MTAGLALKRFEDGYAGVTEYTGSSTYVRVPSMFEGMPVRYISGDAFYETPVTTLLLPMSVKLIGDYDCGYTPLDDEPRTVRFSGLAGKKVTFVCENPSLVRLLVEVPGFNVELTGNLDDWEKWNR